MYNPILVISPTPKTQNTKHKTPNTTKAQPINNLFFYH